jgi:hypothetical protein
VIDPSPVLPNITGEFNIWGEDPVHPLPEGYEKVVDLLEKEIEAKATGSKRPASEGAGGQAKKPRTDVPRASWIEGSSLTAKRNDIGGARRRRRSGISSPWAWWKGKVLPTTRQILEQPVLRLQCRNVMLVYFFKKKKL